QAATGASSTGASSTGASSSGASSSGASSSGDARALAQQAWQETARWARAASEEERAHVVERERQRRSWRWVLRCAIVHTRLHTERLAT
ncbi:MAG: hypothetical protein IVW57_12065, partial [Ktedonobacterales bacterium]|nr:hypothetical protein [Ktedonobacterales bacterium]